MAGRADIAIETNAEGAREWFGAAELAELGLPGLPGDKRMINRRAQDEMWAGRSGADGAPLVRRRAGRGGGNEFHITLLPSAARAELSRRGLIAGTEAEAREDNGDWRWYEAQTRKVKDQAEQRLAIVREVELAEQAGQSRSAAIEAVAATSGTGRSTIYSWFALIEGVSRADRLPALAPRRKGGGASAEIDAALWRLFASDYLRPSAPTLCSCYRRTADKAKELGIAIPGEQTFRRRLKKELHPDVIVLKRGGREALERVKPAQRRTVDHLHALERVNVDGHRFDVFVDMGDGKPVRPTMVAIQDVYSSKLLAWRIDLSESAVLMETARLDRLGKKLNALMKDDLDEDDDAAIEAREEQVEKLLDQLTKIILRPVPRAVRASLGQANKMAAIEVFTMLLLARKSKLAGATMLKSLFGPAIAQAMAQVAKDKTGSGTETDQADGSSEPPAAKGSTAETPGDG